MTIETRTAIEPKDILGIEIECSGCGYRCVRPIRNFHAVPIACPNCNKNWLAMRDEFARLEKLAYDIGLLSNRQDSSVHLRFEIANPAPRIQT